jgi:hypothetical protein
MFDVNLLMAVTDRFALGGPDGLLKLLGETIEVHEYIVTQRDGAAVGPWTTRLRPISSWI